MINKENIKGDYSKFIQKYGIFKKDDIVYRVKKKGDVLKDSERVTFEEREKNFNYYHEKHMVIMTYIEKSKKDSDILKAIKYFIENYNKYVDINDLDKILYKKIKYFIIGNSKWISKHLDSNSYDKKVESIRYVIRSVFITLGVKSFKIIEGTPISVIRKGKITDSIQLYYGIDDKVIEKPIKAKSEDNEYRFPALVVNAMYHKIKISEADKKLLEATKKIVDLFKNEKKMDENEVIGKELVDIKKEIDLVSLVPTRENIHLMIQVLGKMFTLEQINTVVNELK